jgi:hypothetical protein
MKSQLPVAQLLITMPIYLSISAARRLGIKKNQRLRPFEVIR